MGDYSVDLMEKLGQGSFGVVYKGKNKRTGKPVAVKQMKLEEEETGIRLFIGKVNQMRPLLTNA